MAFSWDGRAVGEAPVTRSGGSNQGYCLSRLTFAPPNGLNAPGRHVVRGEGKGHKNPVNATFTITGTAAPAPPPARSATPTAAARPQSTAKPSARPSASASPSATPSASAEAAGVPTESTSTIPQAVVKSSSGGSSTGTVVAIVVMALTIIGAGLLAGLVLRKRGDGEDGPVEIVPAGS